MMDPRVRASVNAYMGALRAGDEVSAAAMEYAVKAGTMVALTDLLDVTRRIAVKLGVEAPGVVAAPGEDGG